MELEWNVGGCSLHHMTEVCTNPLLQIELEAKVEGRSLTYSLSNRLALPSNFAGGLSL